MDRHSSHSQKVPYARKERRKSLFSKVKDSVKEMLSPSWLSDIVSNVKKESPPAGSNDQVPKDKEMFMSPVSSVPASMPRSGMQQQTNFLPFQNQLSTQGNGQPRTLDFRSNMPQGQTAMMASPYQQASIPPPISEFTSSQLPLARLTEKSDSVLANEDTMSQRSDVSKSTSGCSSMVPQADKHGQEKRKISDKDTTGSRSPPSPMAQPSKRQRLQVNLNNSKMWSRGCSDMLVKQQAPAAVNKPSFNTSLFGSPMNDESSLLGTSFHESSFYPGKTTYGGRSSLLFKSRKQKNDLNQSLPSRLSIPVKAFMKAKPRVNPYKEAVTSSTAKRILEALDKMPTPLNDARKIPLIVPKQWTDSPSFFSRDKTPLRSGPPTQKLNINTLASISKNRQVSSTSIEHQQQPSSSQIRYEQQMRPTRQDTVLFGGTGPPGSSAPSGKMRHDKSYHRGSASAKASLEQQDTMILPELKSGFAPLPVSSMPKFSFAAPSSQSTSTPNKPALNFTFSSPIQESVPQTKPVSPKNKAGFQFSSPISLDKKNLPDASRTDKMDSSSLPNKNLVAFTSPGPTFSTAPKPKMNGPSSSETSFGGMAPASELKQGSVMDILGGASSGGLKAASKLKQGSVMDILGGSNSTSSSPALTQSNATLFTGIGGAQVSKGPALSTLFKASGWSCDVCLVNNKNDADACLACMTPRPGVKKAQSATPSLSAVPVTDLFNKFQQPSGSWTCDSCLVSNKSDISKCVACQAQKPGSSTPSHTLLVSSHGSLMPGNWICKTCLIQNKREADVCGACKASKPSTSTPTTSTNDNLFSKFKAPSGQWECEVCLVQNKTESSSCVACQTPKPLKFFKHPPGDWVCDTCLVNNKETDEACVACNYARPGPPRTHTVPSCVKSYTMSQSSGFKIPASETKPCSISLSSEGGFKFIDADVSSTNSTSGFKFGSSSAEPAEKSNSSTLSEGGFKFSGSTTETTPVSGFKFGTSSRSDKENSEKPSAGGFKFGSSDSDTKENSNALPTGGFQFGKPASVSLATPNSVSAETKSVPSSLQAGLAYGQTTENGAKDPVIATTSVPGGFNFKATDSISSASESLQSQAVSTSQSIGGFNFGSKSVNSVTSTGSLQNNFTTQNSVGGFTFTGATATQSNATQGVQKPAENKAFSGFQPSEISTSKPSTFGSGFNFAQQSTEGQNSMTAAFGGNKSSTSIVNPTKRGREEDPSEPQVKKQAFSFASATSNAASTPFQFGATNSATTTSSTSVTTNNYGMFGQQNSTSASIPAPSFNNFATSKPVSTPVPVFGSVIAAQTGGKPPAFGSSTPAFNFTGQKTELSTTGASSAPFQFGAKSQGQNESSVAVTSSSLFQFGAKPHSAAAPAFGSSAGFGVGSSASFGAGNTAAFGDNTQSTTPAFGSTPSSFGSSNMSVVSTASQPFGGKGLLWNSGWKLPVTVNSSCLSTSAAQSSTFYSLSKSVLSSTVSTSAVYVLSSVSVTISPASIPVYKTGLSISSTISSLGSSVSTFVPSVSVLQSGAHGAFCPAESSSSTSNSEIEEVKTDSSSTNSKLQTKFAISQGLNYAYKDTTNKNDVVKETACKNLFDKEIEFDKVAKENTSVQETAFGNKCVMETACKSKAAEMDCKNKAVMETVCKKQIVEEMFCRTRKEPKLTARKDVYVQTVIDTGSRLGYACITDSSVQTCPVSIVGLEHTGIDQEVNTVTVTKVDRSVQTILISDTVNEHLGIQCSVVQTVPDSINKREPVLYKEYRPCSAVVTSANLASSCSSVTPATVPCSHFLYNRPPLPVTAPSALTAATIDNAMSTSTTTFPLHLSDYSLRCPSANQVVFASQVVSGAVISIQSTALSGSSWSTCPVSSSFKYSTPKATFTFSSSLANKSLFTSPEPSYTGYPSPVSNSALSCVTSPVSNSFFPTGHALETKPTICVIPPAVASQPSIFTTASSTPYCWPTTCGAFKFSCSSKPQSLFTFSSSSGSPFPPTFARKSEVVVTSTCKSVPSCGAMITRSFVPVFNPTCVSSPLHVKTGLLPSNIFKFEQRTTTQAQPQSGFIFNQPNVSCTLAKSPVSKSESAPSSSNGFCLSKSTGFVLSALPTFRPLLSNQTSTLRQPFNNTGFNQQIPTSTVSTDKSTFHPPVSSVPVTPPGVFVFGLPSTSLARQPLLDNKCSVPPSVFSSYTSSPIVNDVVMEEDDETPTMANATENATKIVEKNGTFKWQISAFGTSKFQSLRTVDNFKLQPSSSAGSFQFPGSKTTTLFQPLTSQSQVTTSANAPQAKILLSAGTSPLKAYTQSLNSPLKASKSAGAFQYQAATIASASQFQATTNAGASQFQATTNAGASQFQATTNAGASQFQATTNAGASQFQATTNAGAPQFQATTNAGALQFQAATNAGAPQLQAATNAGASQFQATTSAGTSEMKSPTSRKVCFSFCPPLDIAISDEMRQPSPRLNSAARSILKSKTNEMVSAFSSTTMLGEDEHPGSPSNTSMSRFSPRTFTPTKDPSASSIFGGVKDFVSTDDNDTTKRSVTLESDFKTYSIESEQNSSKVFTNGGGQPLSIFHIASTSKTSSFTHIDQPKLNLYKDNMDYKVSLNESPVSPGAFVFKGATTKSRSLFTTSLKQQNTKNLSFPSYDKTLSESKAATPGVSTFSGSATTKRSFDSSTPSRSKSTGSNKLSSSLIVFTAPPVTSGVSAFSGSATTKRSVVSSTLSRSQSTGSNKLSSSLFMFTASQTTTSSLSTSQAAAGTVSASSSKSDCRSSSSNTSTDSSSSSTSCESDHSVTSANSSHSDCGNTEDGDHVMEADNDKEMKNGDNLSKRSSRQFNAFSGKGNRSWNAKPPDDNESADESESRKVPEKEACGYYRSRTELVSIIPDCVCSSPLSVCPVFSHCSAAVFNNSVAPVAAVQATQGVYQFGMKPTETAQPATGAAFNFNATPAGLGNAPSFNFGASSAPGFNAFSATAAPGGERKIKKAVRKIRR